MQKTTKDAHLHLRVEQELKDALVDIADTEAEGDVSRVARAALKLWLEKREEWEAKSYGKRK